MIPERRRISERHWWYLLAVAWVIVIVGNSLERCERPVPDAGATERACAQPDQTGPAPLTPNPCTG
ncbi:hypothetical protein [Oricola sp.]|uniref:hypothetical protein n=1 Tax=Oricola sp. TaxID=1979950 RepID=UPI003BA8CA7A